jgi:hypothetical protein
MKMLFSAIMISSIIDYFLIKKYDLDNNNIIFSTFVKALISIPIFLIIYMPIYNLIGDNLIVDLIILFITIYFIQIIDYIIMTKENSNILNIAGLICIIICYIIFGLLTYNPPKTNLFYDDSHNKYGINIYTI